MAFLCSVEQIDAELNRGGTASTYPAQAKLDARDAATAAFEREAGVAFAPRSVTRVLREPGRGFTELPDTRVQSVTGVNVGGVPWTLQQLAGVTVDADAVYGLGYGYGPVEVTYVHGYAETPADVSRAIAVLAGSILKDGPYDDRGFGVTDDGGSVRLLTASIGGAAFSIPEVESALRRYRVVFAL